MFMKIIILSIGFVLVVFLMSKLGNNGLPSGFLSIFGLPASTQQVSDGGLDTRGVATLMSTMDWCETRVAELELRGGFIIRQVNMKWMGVWGGNSRPLGDLVIEKWFGRNCKVHVEKIADNPGSDFQPYMTVKFIKGEPVTLLRSADGYFKWKNEIFRSTELESAIAELAAQAQPAAGG